MKQKSNTSYLLCEFQAEPLTVCLLRAEKRPTTPEPPLLEDGHTVTEPLLFIQVEGCKDDRATWVQAQGRQLESK
jgi:hypothetical protein